MSSRLSLFIHLFLFTQTLFATGVLRYEDADINKVVVKKSADLLSKGGAVVTDQNSLAALQYNPSAVATLQDFLYETNTSFVSNKYIFYQNTIAIPLIFGTIAVGVTMNDKADEFLRMNTFYDVTVYWGGPIYDNFHIGVGYIADPWRVSMMTGIYMPLKTNIQIFKFLGFWDFNYAASLYNMNFIKRFDVDQLKPKVAQGIEFYTIVSDYIKLKNYIEMNFANDFVSNEFHAGMRLFVLDYFYISVGGYANRMTAIDYPTWGGGVQYESPYLSLSAFYGAENVNGIINQSFGGRIEFRKFGKKAKNIRAKIRDYRFSPRNQDGFKDNSDIRFNYKKRVQIVYWKIEITNEFNELVKTIDSNQKKYRRKKVFLPRKVNWNGRDDANSYVPDGKYLVRLYYIDDRSERYYYDLPPVFVDNTAPYVHVQQPSTEAKVKQDGSIDPYQIFFSELKTDIKDNWTITFKDAGKKEIRKFRRSGNQLTTGLSWDIRDSYGKIVDPGSYTVEVRGSDPAGNVLDPIEFKLRVVDDRFRISLTSSQRFISPNGDKIHDVAEFYLGYQVKENIDSWEFKIHDANYNNVYVLKKDNDKIPQRIIWHGKKNGITLKQGVYYAQLSIQYKNSRVSKSLPVAVVIDLNPPEFKHNRSPDTFSPDGDNISEQVYITINVRNPSEIQNWKVTIYSYNDRKPFRVFKGLGAPDKKIIWDGTSDSGKIVESLTKYYYDVELSDKAGNRVTKVGKTINVDYLLFKLSDNLIIEKFGITFDRQKDIISPYVKNRLDIVAKLMRKRLKGFAVIIEGHSDLNGFPVRNFELGKLRAESVKNYLVETYGFKSDSITTISKGMSEPVTRVMTKEEQTRNRRVSLIFYRDKDGI